MIYDIYILRYIYACFTKNNTACANMILYFCKCNPTLYSLPECQGTRCSKQAPYLKFKRQQQDSNPEPLSLKTNTQPFNQAGQSVRLRTKWLWVRNSLLSFIISEYYLSASVNMILYFVARSDCGEAKHGDFTTLNLLHLWYLSST